MANNWSNIDTDDYDLYHSEGENTALPGTPNETTYYESQPYFSPANMTNSTMDKDDKNTGPTTNFWEYYPLTIDSNGYIFYYEENTGINVRGPEGGIKYIRFSDLTEAEIAQLKGANGLNGTDGRNGRDGTDGINGLDAYHVWLQDNDYLESQHPITEFYSYLASFVNLFIKEGTGTGSVIVNYNGDNNIASGQGSFASGNGTTAAGENSFTAGLGTISSVDNKFVIGKYNEESNSNVFEIGIGVGNANRKTGFSVDWNGNILASNEITDGYNNILSNKVDKIENKSLSTNDFTDFYKDFIDEYSVDEELNNSSLNPVQNKIIYNALESLRAEITAFPPIDTNSEDINFPLLSYQSTGVTEQLDEGIKFPELIYNPGRENLLLGKNIVSNYDNSICLGNNLITGAVNQTIFGQYNISNSTDAFIFGDGNEVNRKNLFTISKTGNIACLGDITAGGEIQDGNGNRLSDKQDILLYDETPTLNSTKLMTSGAIYNAFIDVGIVPGQGYDIPELRTIQTQVNNLNNQVTALSTQITKIKNNLYYIPDDEDNLVIYKLGIENGEFYIQNQNVEEEEENN